MAEIISSAGSIGFLGLVKVDLSKFWEANNNGLVNFKSYLEYKNMRGYLEGTNYVFGWHNTGKYLPDYVLLEPDVATIFALKYCT